MKFLLSIFPCVLVLALFFPFGFPNGTAAAIVKLNGPLPADSLIVDWQASPDSGTVVYSTGPPQRTFRNALFSVPAAGGTAVRITPPLVTGQERVTAYGVSPDSSRVLFLIQADENAPRHLYSVPIGGPHDLAVWLDETIDTQVNTFLFSPDGQKVVYQAVDPAVTRWGLYSVPVSGPANSSLRIDGDPNSHVDSGYKISPDSGRVVYRAPCDSGPNGGQSCYGLFSVPISGGTAVKLSLDHMTYNYIGSGIEISSNSQHVVYRAYYYFNPGASQQIDLYSIPIAGPISGLARLSQNHDAPIAEPWAISSDSGRVVYRAWEGASTTYELYSIALDGTPSTKVKLNGPLVDNGQVYEYIISPDSGRVVYRSLKESGSDTIELYSTPIAGPNGTAVLINQPLTGTGLGVRRFIYTPNSQRTAFEVPGYLPGINSYALFGVPAAGPHSEQVQVGSIYDYTVPFDVSQDSSWVYYIRDGNLFKSPIAGPLGNTVKLDGPPNHTADTFMETPNGARLIYSAEAYGNLYAVDTAFNGTFIFLYLPLIIR